MKSRGIALLAGLAALMVAGVIAGAGAAGTNGLAAGNIVYSGVQPTFAPDGSALAYVSDRSGATEIWAQSLLTRTPAPIQLTSDGASKSHPSWGRMRHSRSPSRCPGSDPVESAGSPPAAKSRPGPLPPIAVAPPAA